MLASRARNGYALAFAWFGARSGIWAYRVIWTRFGRTCVFILLCCCTTIISVLWMIMSLNRQAVFMALVFGSTLFIYLLDCSIHILTRLHGFPFCFMESQVLFALSLIHCSKMYLEKGKQRMKASIARTMSRHLLGERLCIHLRIYAQDRCCCEFVQISRH